jgi:hypothetical protein
MRAKLCATTNTKRRWTFFDESMVDTNIWPRERRGHEIMQQMTFMVIYEARDLNPLAFLFTPALQDAAD